MSILLDERPEVDPPNPGSAEALAQGCICAQADNHYGQRKPWPGGWWITAGCPLHAPGQGEAP